MNITSFLNLTINDILHLANGDLDDQELASRLARRLTLEVRKTIGGGLAAFEQQELTNFSEVTNRDLARRGDHAKAQNTYKVWIRQGGPEGTLFWENVAADNADKAAEWAKAAFPNDCKVERVALAKQLI